MSCVEAAHEHKVDNFVNFNRQSCEANKLYVTKRLSEVIIQSFVVESNTDFSAVRFGNVLVQVSSVIPLFEKQIENGGPVTAIIKIFLDIL